MVAAAHSIADQALAETVERALATYPKSAPRIRRGAAILALYHGIQALGGDRYAVRSEANASRTYTVKLGDPLTTTCDCPDHRYRQYDCKHYWTAYLFTVAAERFTVLSHRALLTPQELRRLTLFKWTYSLESTGLDRQTAKRMVFAKWQLRGERGLAQRQISA